MTALNRYFFIALLSLTACTPSRNVGTVSSSFTRIESMLHEKDFFSARDLYAQQKEQLTPAQQLIIEAYLDHAFNRPLLSNQKIAALRAAHWTSLSSSSRLALIEQQQFNYGRLFQYKEALAVINEILEEYRDQLSPDEKDDYSNMQVIWRSLQDQPAQTVQIKATTTLPISRDKANLANIQAVAAADTIGFIFDTGANFSTATATTAKRFGMRLLPDSITVGAITGQQVKAVLGICPQLSLGNIQISNAVFIVFPDSALAFPQISFQINGILGFPLLEALKEISITKQDRLVISSSPAPFTEQNLALDFLTPVIRLNGNHFTFDTGADQTMLYPKYYTANKPYIRKHYKKTTIQLGGAGGVRSVQGYYVPFRFKMDDRDILIDSVQLLDEPLAKGKTEFYGNVGQDLIKKFDRMTLNFQSMYVRFD